MVGGVWNGFLLGRVGGQPIPCRFCGAPDKQTTNNKHQGLRQVGGRFLCARFFCSRLSLASDPMEESHGDAESGGCARGSVTSSNPSAWPLATVLHHS